MFDHSNFEPDSRNLSDVSLGCREDKVVLIKTHGRLLMIFLMRQLRSAEHLWCYGCRLSSRSISSILFNMWLRLLIVGLLRQIFRTRDSLGRVGRLGPSKLNAAMSVGVDHQMLLWLGEEIREYICVVGSAFTDSRCPIWSGIVHSVVMIHNLLRCCNWMIWINKHHMESPCGGLIPGLGKAFSYVGTRFLMGWLHPDWLCWERCEKVFQCIVGSGKWDRRETGLVFIRWFGESIMLSAHPTAIVLTIWRCF